MPSEKHLKRAREMSWSGVDGRVSVIAAALEAVERETAERCAEIARLEMVNAEETGAESDETYNQACGDIGAAILTEFGIAEDGR